MFICIGDSRPLLFNCVGDLRLIGNTCRNSLVALLWFIHRRGLRLLLLLAETHSNSHWRHTPHSSLDPTRGSSCSSQRHTPTSSTLNPTHGSSSFIHHSFASILLPLSTRSSAQQPIASSCARPHQSSASTRSIHRFHRRAAANPFVKPFGTGPIASLCTRIDSDPRCAIDPPNQSRAIDSILPFMTTRVIPLADPTCGSFHPSAQSRPPCDPTHGSMALCCPMPLSFVSGDNFYQMLD